MAVYYNKNKKNFIESDLSAKTLEKHGYGEVSIKELKIGYNKKMWVLVMGDNREIVGNFYIEDSEYCKCVSEKKVKSLEEIRAYFAYLKDFVYYSLPYEASCSCNFEKVRIEENHFDGTFPFEALISTISYYDYLSNPDKGVKGVSFKLVISLYTFVSKIRYDSDYNYEYSYCPYISILAAFEACKHPFGYSYYIGGWHKDHRKDEYDSEISEFSKGINYKYSFYNIVGMKLKDIDFDDIYGSLTAFNSLKKNFEMIISANKFEIDKLKDRMVSEVSKEFEKEFVVNEEIRKKYADDIAMLISKMDTLAGDSKFTKIKEDFFREIGLATQNSFLEFRKMLEKTISEIEGKKQEIILSNNQFVEKLSHTKKQIEADVKQIIQSGNDGVDKLRGSFRELEEKREQLVKDITTEVIKEVVKKNPMQEINISLKDGDIKRKIKGIYHESFKKVLQLIYLNSPVFLVGPAGCGKNVMLKQAAKVLDLQFYYINDAREKYDLLGFVDANGKYQETQFFKAFTKGGLLMIDELDSADASVLLLLNSALGTGDDFYMTFPDGNHYQAHRDFHLVAAANTFGTGANQTYNGRNQLDGASLNRFVAVEVDYDTNIEKALVNNSDILSLYWEVRRIIRENEINYVVSTRNILNADKYFSAKVFSYDDIFAWTLVGSMTEFDLGVIISNIKTTDKYSHAFIEYVKKNYNIEEAKDKCKTKTRTRNSYGYGNNDDDGDYGNGFGGYGGYRGYV